MGQVRHGSATTTHVVRAAIQRSQASLAALSRDLGINPKTVAKWRKRATVEDLKTGPKAPHSTTLSEAEEAAVVAFRRHTLLPLDDCLYALQPSIPRLTRSALHRCLQRHGISRLPDIDGDKPKRQRFKRYPIGLLPHGYRRGADRRRQALSLRRHRSHQQVRGDATGRNTAWARQMRFDMIGEEHDIEHRLTKPNHPWTNGLVERMNRTIK